jgi:hypothetical protein
MVKARLDSRFEWHLKGNFAGSWSRWGGSWSTQTMIRGLLLQFCESKHSLDMVGGGVELDWFGCCSSCVNCGLGNSNFPLFPQPQSCHSPLCQSTQREKSQNTFRNKAPFDLCELRLDYGLKRIPTGPNSLLVSGFPCGVVKTELAHGYHAKACLSCRDKRLILTSTLLLPRQNRTAKEHHTKRIYRAECSISRRRHAWWRNIPTQTESGLIEYWVSMYT